MAWRPSIAAAPIYLLLNVLVVSALAMEQVDQELILAVDTSSSVSYREYRLQMDGYAAAFRNPALIAAIEEAAPNGVAVALIHWSGAEEQRIVVDWTRIHNQTSSVAFADRVSKSVRIFLTGQTDVAAAIRYATTLFSSNGYDSQRRTVDISGDGRSNQGENPIAARDAAVAAGLTINGLAILSDVPVLDRYYLDNVIGGLGSFSMVVDEFEDFEGAIVLKLINEITGNTIAGAEPDGDGHRRRSDQSADSTPSRKAARLSPSDWLR